MLLFKCVRLDIMEMIAKKYVSAEKAVVTSIRGYADLDASLASMVKGVTTVSNARKKI